MPEQIVIDQPDTTEVSTDAHASVQAATALVISDRISHEEGLTAYKTLGEMEKKVADIFLAPKKAAHAAHRAITKAEKDLIAPIKTAKQIVNKKLASYENEQEQIRKRKQAEADRIAREAAEKEQLEAAQAAQDAGNDREAEEIISQPTETPAVHVEPETAKVEGVSARTTWSAEVTNPVALIQFVASHTEWNHLLEPNQTALNAVARAQKENLNIPGVKAVSKTVRAVR